MAAPAADEAPRRSLRLGFAGTPAFAVPALDARIGSPHRVVAVFTKADRASGRGQKVHASPVKTRALELGLAVHQPASFKDPEVCALLAELELDVLVVVAYGLILPRAALDLPRLGCINIHASLLPRWRGAAPIQRALLAGDRATGISIMRMEEKLDTGPVFLERAVVIGPRETGGSLHDRLAGEGASAVLQVIDELSTNSARSTPQREDGVTYASKIDKAEGLIDWSRPAVEIDRQVRAFNPWPIAETRLDGEQIG